MWRMLLLLGIATVMASSPARADPAQDAKFCYGGAVGRVDAERALAACEAALNPSVITNNAVTKRLFGKGELSPADRAAVLVNRAIIYMRRNANYQAQDDLDAAIGLSPSNLQAHLLRAQIGVQRNDPDAALADYTAALRLDPGNLDAYRGRAAIYRQADQPALARADYERVRSLAPGDRQAAAAIAAIDASQRARGGGRVADGGGATPGAGGSVQDEMARMLAGGGGTGGGVGTSPLPPGDGPSGAVPPAAAPRAPAIAPAPTITADDEGDPDERNNRLIQQRLNALGYGPLPVSGELDDVTDRAIRQFGEDNRRRRPPGSVSQGLLADLDQALADRRAAKPAAVATASSVDLVRRAQVALTTLGLFKTTPTGTYGSQTRAALAQAGIVPPADGRLEETMVAELEARAATVRGGDYASPRIAAAAPPAPPPPAAPSMTAQLEAERQLLTRVQERLGKLGVRLRNRAGTLDPETERAIGDFQAQAGLPVDGRPSEQLVARLDEAVAGRARGDSERQTALLAVQRILRGMGHDGIGEPDGRPSAATLQALAEEGFPVSLGDPAALDAPRLKVVATQLVQKRLVAEERQRKELWRQAVGPLRDLGYDVDAPDGIPDEKARKALADFGRKMGRTQTAALDEGLLRLLQQQQAADAERKDKSRIAALAQESTKRLSGLPDAASTAAVPATGPASVVLPPSVVPAAPAVVAAAPKADDAAAAGGPVIPAGGGERVALVIGNGGYNHLPALPNPTNDAADMRVLLERIGFQVYYGVDLGRREMDDVMIAFARAARRAKVSFAFYAGHGVQVDGTNFLIPVDTLIEDDADLRRTIRLDDMIRDAGASAELAVVMVDACRDNPFEALQAQRLNLSAAIDTSSSRGTVTRSLTQMPAGLATPQISTPHTLVVYATAATRTAEDGNGRNSPFTAALLKNLEEPIDIRRVIGKVTDAVGKASQNRQRPDLWGSLGGEEYFLVRPEAAAQVLEAGLAPQERAALQRSFRRLQMYPGADDGGAFDQALRNAIRGYQAQNGMAVTGYLTVAQMRRLTDDAGRVRPPLPLPLGLDLDRAMRPDAVDPETMWLKGMVFDPAYQAAGAFTYKSIALAKDSYLKAAEGGNADAALRLGMILKDGEGVQPDLPQAVRWLKVAASAGRPAAHYALAELSRDGRGVPQNPAEAAQRFRLAATGGMGEALVQLRAMQER